MKKAIAVLIAASMLITPAYAATQEAIDYVQSEGIIEGDENGSLNLEDNVTRAEAAKMLIEALGIDKDSHSSSQTFSDVDEDSWAYDYIETAAGNGFINGFEDGTFRPNEYVTYEQAIKMFLGKNMAMSYPAEYVASAIDMELLDNVSALMGEKMSRADMMQLIYNIAELVKAGVSNTFGYIGLDMMSGKLNGIYGSAGAESASDQSVQQITPPAGSSSSSAIPNEGAASGGGAGGGSSSGSISSSGGIMNGDAASGGSYDAYYNPYRSSESYSAEDENIFKKAALSPLSTFSIDTDTASYSNMRRFAMNGQPLPKGSIRTEELINYFDYDLPQPTDGTPFSVTTETAQCPWNSEHLLAMINIQGEELTERQPQNLVLLIDTSGSMYSYNKLPLVKSSMELLLNNLDERDTISIVTYASGTNVILSGANGSERDKIINAINGLYAGGATNGEGGLQLAYEQAEKFKSDGNNRIILCTDGDFNVGISDNDELKSFITQKRENNIYLSVLGFGMGNYKDDKMEILADNGNGNYYYIDNLREAKKVFVDEMTATLYTIAKDVKIQVEFNPATVDSYRLIGYENRVLETEDFEDDGVDAGELGAGANVTALYEIVPASEGQALTGDSSLRYQTSTYSGSSEIMDVKLRYKLPNGTESILKEYPVDGNLISDTSDSFRFAAAAAELGMILNDSEYKGSSSYDSVMELARGAVGEDKFGFRHEFVQLVDLLRYTNRGSYMDTMSYGFYDSQEDAPKRDNKPFYGNWTDYIKFLG